MGSSSSSTSWTLARSNSSRARRLRVLRRLQLPCDEDGRLCPVTAQNADTFRTHLREFLSHGKPVAVTEYGTCAYSGAGELGGMAWQPPPSAVPDEDEQVCYFNELLDIFEEEGVDTALWFSFANYDKPGDRDIASYGVVRMLDQIRWEPKKVFHAMAARYERR